MKKIFKSSVHSSIGCFFLSLLMLSAPIFGQTIPTGTWIGNFSLLEKPDFQRPIAMKYAHGMGYLNMKSNGKGNLVVLAFNARSGELTSFEAPVYCKKAEREGMLTLALEKIDSAIGGDQQLIAAFFATSQIYFANDTLLQQVSSIKSNEKTGKTKYSEGLWFKKTIDVVAFNSIIEECNNLVMKKNKGIALKAVLRGGDIAKSVNDMAVSKFNDCIGNLMKKEKPYTLTGTGYNTVIVMAKNMYPVKLSLDNANESFKSKSAEENIEVQWKNTSFMGIENSKLFALTKAEIVLTNKQNGKKISIQYPQVIPALYTDVKMSIPKATVIDVGEIGDFQEGHAIYRKGERFGMIGGKEGIEIGKYDFKLAPWNSGSDKPLCGFYDGISIAYNVETGKAGFINTEGKVVIPFDWREVTPFQPDGYAWGKFYDEKLQKEYWFFFDKKGRRYATTESGYNEEPLMRKLSSDNKTTEFYRKNGKLAFKTKYTIQRYAGSGLYRVTNPADALRKVGFIDTTGKLVMPFKISEGSYINDFHENIALYIPKYKDEYEAAYLDKTGKEIILIKPSKEVERRNFQDMKYGHAKYQIISKESGYSDVLIDTLGVAINVNNLFWDANPSILSDLSYVWKPAYSLKYINHVAEGVLFRTELGLKTNSKTAKAFSNGQERSTGGVGSHQFDYEQKGMGLMDYEGNILIPPVFSSIGKFDPTSGLAKAIYYPGKSEPEVQGFINTQGEFVLILAKPYTNFMTQ